MDTKVPADKLGEWVIGINRESLKLDTTNVQGNRFLDPVASLVL